MELSIRIGKDFEKLAYTPSTALVSEHHFYWDATECTGGKVPTGTYEYEASMTSTFEGILPSTGQPSGVDVHRVATVRRRIRINNKEASPFGAGWNLEELEEIVTNPDGSVLYVTGDQLLSHFKKGFGIGLVAGSLAGAGFSGDGGPANQTLVNEPTMILADSSGRLVFTDTKNHRIRRIDGSGVIETLAGDGSAGYSGDGGPAVSASLNEPTYLALDGNGNITFVDQGNSAVRRIDASGTIDTVAGGFGDPLDPQNPLSGIFPRGVAASPGGDLYISADRGVYRLPAGGGDPVLVVQSGGSSGDNGPANQAGVLDPQALAFDPQTNALYIADAGQDVIRRVDCSQIITTFAGGGTALREEVSATRSKLYLNHVFGASPLVLDGVGNLYFLAHQNQGTNLRRVTRDGIIETVGGVAGTGQGFDGSGSQEASDTVLISSSGMRVTGIGVTGSGDVLYATGQDAAASPASTIAVLDHDLGGTRFYTTPGAVFSELRGTPDGGFSMREKDGRVHRFDALGRLTDTADRNGNTRVYGYSSVGLLATITDEAGLLYTFAHDGNGKVRTITDPAGRITALTVDTAGDLTAIDLPDGARWQYEYNDHLMTRETSPRGHDVDIEYSTGGIVSRIIEPDASEARFEPGDGQHLINTASAPATLVSSEAYEDVYIDLLGRTTRMRTNANGSILNRIDPLGRTTGSQFDRNVATSFRRRCSGQTGACRSWSGTMTGTIWSRSRSSRRWARRSPSSRRSPRSR